MPHHLFVPVTLLHMSLPQNFHSALDQKDKTLVLIATAPHFSFAHVPPASHRTSICLQSNLILLHRCFQAASQPVARESSRGNEYYHVSLLLSPFAAAAVIQAVIKKSEMTKTKWEAPNVKLRALAESDRRRAEETRGKED